MTNKQKIELKLSEVRTRLNVISGLEGEAFTDEIRTEADKLKTEFSDLETRHQAAIIAEGDEQRKLEGDHPDLTPNGESKEIRELIEKVSISDYLSPAAAGAGVTGAAAELNAALEVPVVGKSGGVAIPWRVLLTDERREADQGETEKTGLHRYRRLCWRRNVSASYPSASFRYGHPGGALESVSIRSLLAVLSGL